MAIHNWNDFYVWNVSFEREAARSTDSYLTPLLEGETRSKQKCVVSKLHHLKNLECTICLTLLDSNPTQPDIELH